MHQNIARSQANNEAVRRKTHRLLEEKREKEALSPTSQAVTEK